METNTGIELKAMPLRDHFHSFSTYLKCVTIVDLVTSRTANRYGELLDELAAERTAISRTSIYAATCRGRRTGPRWRLECWEHELIIGAALPTLPLWLSEDFMVPLELEATYEETCRSLRIR